MTVFRREPSERAFRVNPYTRWVYDHPERLLPEPTPEALARRRRERRPARVHVELGSGSGNFLVQLATRHPEDDVVGFELRFKRLVRTAQKAEKRGLANLWVLREAGEAFWRYFAPESVDALYLHFPDPWPKRAQWKKRLLSPALLETARRTLKPGGGIHFKTDHSGYFLHALSLIRARPRWRIRHFSNDLRRHRPPVPQLRSEFEQMFVSQRKAVYFLLLEKTPGA